MTSLDDDRRVWAADVRAALDTLPAEQQRVLELSYGMSLSQEDIADRTGMPSASVSGAIAIGMRTVARALQAADRRAAERRHARARLASHHRDAPSAIFLTARAAQSVTP